jgi:hypothetical protein
MGEREITLFIDIGPRRRCRRCCRLSPALFFLVCPIRQKDILLHSRWLTNNMMTPSRWERLRVRARQLARPR